MHRCTVTLERIPSIAHVPYYNTIIIDRISSTKQYHMTTSSTIYKSLQITVKDKRNVSLWPSNAAREPIAIIIVRIHTMTILQRIVYKETWTESMKASQWYEISLTFFQKKRLALFNDRCSPFSLSNRLWEECLCILKPDIRLDACVCQWGMFWHGSVSEDEY